MAKSVHLSESLPPWDENIMFLLLQHKIKYKKEIFFFIGTGRRKKNLSNIKNNNYMMEKIRCRITTGNE